MKPRARRRVRSVTLSVACAQLAARPLGQAREALADAIAAIRSAGRERAELVVLPECTYPGDVLLSEHPYGAHIPSDDEALAAFARQARRSRLTAIVGIARRQPGGTLRNEAVMLDNSGNLVGSYAKMRLWNFDRRWFHAGKRLPVFDTAFGRIGIMICADGRNPEIARTLAAEGAWLIADPTAWVGIGPAHDRIANVQADYMLRVRALENGVWIAAADKCGSELGAVHYVGRSQIVAPDGSVAACAGASQPQLILADVHRTKPSPRVVALSRADMAALRAGPRPNGRLRRLPPRMWLAIYQSAPRRRDDPLALRALAAQGACATIRTGQAGSSIARALRAARQVRSAVMTGEMLLAPEPARAAALRGVDLIVWASPPSRTPIFDIARTRAIENRVYVAICARANSLQPACLINPDGSLAGCALAGQPSGFVAALDLVSARRKEVVPGTQTFADRVPNAYRWLDRRSGVIAS
jgi:predicted amidohydrolase